MFSFILFTIKAENCHYVHYTNVKTLQMFNLINHRTIHHLPLIQGWVVGAGAGSIIIILFLTKLNLFSTYKTANRII